MTNPSPSSSGDKGTNILLRDIANWRPISLINVDVKIGSKAIAKRLEAVLPCGSSLDIFWGKKILRVF